MYKVCIFVPNSNDEVEEGEPGSDSDFDINAKKEVSLWYNRYHTQKRNLKLFSPIRFSNKKKLLI